ncbi:MAG: DedA family protein [Patescibacteria group bacterium]|jgi:membrane protein DedA with SNARE-associated domain
MLLLYYLWPEYAAPALVLTFMEIINLIISSLVSIAQNFSYGGIVFLMTVESTFFPLPSEIVIPPYAYLAAQGQLNLFGVILSGTLGSVIGASINYFISRVIGRAIVYRMADHRYARYVFINRKKMEDAEKFFLKSANMSTFAGRLIPGVRHLISIPAGIFGMKFSNFIFYTSLGSIIWVSLLSALGYFFGQNQDLLLAYYKELSIGIFTLLALGLIILFFYKKNSQAKKS